MGIQTVSEAVGFGVVQRQKEHRGLTGAYGPVVFVEDVTGVGFDEMVEIVGTDGATRLGRVMDVSTRAVAVQVFQGTAGLNLKETSVRFLGHPLEIPVSKAMLGRVLDFLGRPRDGGPEPVGTQRLSVEGPAINPTAREYPRDHIETGITGIDVMNTLIRGQKLPIFSGAGLPHNQLAVQIARQARIIGEKEQFAMIFAAMGVSHDTAEFFHRSLAESGALEKTAMFLSLADDPPVERLVTPRSALTLAEYLAFSENMHVLVVMTDMTNYAEALREVSSARGELPSRKGYPGYLYSDLASIYERAGRIRGSRGSVTQIPILTMPNDDIGHPVPDLTGFITEGQIVLSREMMQKGIYPPIAVLPSLSRLMKDGIGEGHTRPDHPHVSSQLYASYTEVQRIRSLAAVIGADELSELDRRYLKFGDLFEREFIAQGEDEFRPLETSLDIGWKALSVLPKGELLRVSKEEIENHYQGQAIGTGRENRR